MAWYLVKRRDNFKFYLWQYTGSPT